ncbi:MAG TPA: PAS domain-containing protein [Bryobacteraceae bacterium]|jgi:PAS domain S-box-containing protein|nr:PAS domain-containing protein [Bryobacteraceae bacterium]
MLWLYLLGAITVLCIALRRVIHRQTPLSDELYSTKVAFDHLQSGVAWIPADGTVGTVNSALAATLNSCPKALAGRDWLDIFPRQEHERVRETYSRMLLAGMAELEAFGQRVDGTYAWLNVLLVAVHDHKMRFVGHHCLVLDATHTRLLEDRIQVMETRLKERESLSFAR